MLLRTLLSRQAFNRPSHSIFCLSLPPGCSSPLRRKPSPARQFTLRTLLSRQALTQSVFRLRITPLFRFSSIELTRRLSGLQARLHAERLFDEYGYPRSNFVHPVPKILPHLRHWTTPFVCLRRACRSFTLGLGKRIVLIESLSLIFELQFVY